MVRMYLTLGITILAVTQISADEIPIDSKEDTYNNFWCAAIGGKREVRHDYTTKDNISSYIKIDCETHDLVIEGGLDKRSSLDSIQQSVFAGVLSGKKAAIYIYDTDGKEGKYEYRIRTAAQALGIQYFSLSNKKE